MSAHVGATESTARHAFDVNIQRASYFLDIHEESQLGAGAPAKKYRELPRGAVVFAIGALDAYLSEVSAEIIVRDSQNYAVRGDTRDILKRIQGDIPTIALEISVLPDQKTRLARIREVLVDHFHNKASMHGAKAVSATAARVGASAADVWSALGGRDRAITQKDLDDWTDIRHQIVHQGKKPTVRREQARECIAIVTEIVNVIDKFALKDGGA